MFPSAASRGRGTAEAASPPCRRAVTKYRAVGSLATTASLTVVVLTANVAMAGTHTVVLTMVTAVAIGGVVSTTQVTFTGVGARLPAPSTARTSTVVTPSPPCCTTMAATPGAEQLSAATTTPATVSLQQNVHWLGYASPLHDTATDDDEPLV